jgi:integrase
LPLTFSGPVAADRTRAYLRAAFRWHSERDHRFKLRDTFIPVTPRTPEKQRLGGARRKLSDQELRDVWAALDTIDKPVCFARYIRALIFTGLRRNEVADVTWAEIKGDTWIIPAKRHKTGDKIGDHAVPITAELRTLFGDRSTDATGRPFVFSTDGGRTAFKGFGKAKATLDKKIAALRAKEGREPMPPWRLHDLRRTARSLMSRAGVEADNAERAHAHVIPGVRRVYDDPLEYIDQKRDAFEKLAGMVQSILAPGGTRAQ